jgi:hypothetical protein
MPRRSYFDASHNDEDAYDGVSARPQPHSSQLEPVSRIVVRPLSSISAASSLLLCAQTDAERASVRGSVSPLLSFRAVGSSPGLIERDVECDAIALKYLKGKGNNAVVETDAFPREVRHPRSSASSRSEVSWRS